MKKRYWYLFWLAAVLLLFFANGSLLITDSVESNYALTAKEMVLSGDWLSPQIYGNYWYDKPVLFYWLTALSFKIFGFTEFAARFFPSVFGLLSLGLVCWGGKKLYSAKAGFYSAVILLSSVEFFLISKSIITDSVLFFFFSGTLLFFYLAYSTNDSRYTYLMYVCAALATLTKGPIGFLLPGLIITLFLFTQKDWRSIFRMRILSGTLLFLLIAAPWYLAMYYMHGNDFINVFLGTHNFLRATVSEHPRDNVIYYYTLVNLLALFPWSGMVITVGIKKIQQHDFTLLVQEKFLLLWAGTVFVFYQCMATKYLTYTYPLLFPVALLLGGYLAKHMEVFKSKFNLVFMTIFYATLLAAAFAAQQHGIGSHAMAVPGSMAAAAAVFYMLRPGRAKVFHLTAIISICLYISLIYSVAVPFSELRSAKSLGLALKTACAEDNIGLYGNYPASAVFYSDKRLIKLLPKDDLTSFRPQAYSWSSKNVMPYDDVANKIYNTVAVQRGKEKNFVDQSDSRWKETAAIGKWLILAR